ncbi:MAG: NUDIX domain-containing protein [Ilumatobacteraceae bacterium]
MSRLIRTAVRGLVIDHDDRVLMVRLVFPHGAYWVLPGGGIDEGEDMLDALRRELHEETGLVDPEIGPHVWNRLHEFRMVDAGGREWHGQRESVFLVRTGRFDPAPAFSDAELRAENLHGHRWWSVDEIEGHTGPDVFAPRDIAVHVRSVLRHGPPAVPFEIHQVN